MRKGQSEVPHYKISGLLSKGSGPSSRQPLTAWQFPGSERLQAAPQRISAQTQTGRLQQGKRANPVLFGSRKTRERLASILAQGCHRCDAKYHQLRAPRRSHCLRYRIGQESRAQTEPHSVWAPGFPAALNWVPPAVRCCWGPGTALFHYWPMATRQEHRPATAQTNGDAERATPSSPVGQW